MIIYKCRTYKRFQQRKHYIEILKFIFNLLNSLFIKCPKKDLNFILLYYDKPKKTYAHKSKYINILQNRLLLQPFQKKIDSNSIELRFKKYVCFLKYTLVNSKTLLMQ